MKLVKGLATVDDFETGEHLEEYKVVYESKTHKKLIECLEWFARSEYKKLLVIPDRQYTRKANLRSLYAERMKDFKQPDDCFVSVIMKYGRVYLEKS